MIVGSSLVITVALIGLRARAIGPLKRRLVRRTEKHATLSLAVHYYIGVPIGVIALEAICAERVLLKFPYVEIQADGDLAQVAFALGRFGGVFRLGERGQHEGRQNCNDGNYNQQFDQSEARCTSNTPFRLRHSEAAPPTCSPYKKLIHRTSSKLAAKGRMSINRLSGCAAPRPRSYFASRH